MARDPGHSRSYLKYEVVYRGFTHQLLDFQFSADSQAVVVLSQAEIIVLDPFLWSEKIKLSRLPCPQTLLIVPPSFDPQTLPFLIFDNSANNKLLVHDVATPQQNQQRVEPIESGYQGFKPIGVLQIEEYNGRFKVLGVSKDGMLRVCTIELY